MLLQPVTTNRPANSSEEPRNEPACDHDKLPLRDSTNAGTGRMRLTSEQVLGIRRAVERTLGNGVSVWVFGSRADDGAKGGDIDLYVEFAGTPAEILDRELRLYAALRRELGEQRVDLVVHRRGTPMRPIDLEARRQAVRL